MKFSTVIFKQNEFVFDNVKYAFYDIEKVKAYFSKNIKVILEDEPLMLNKFKIKTKRHKLDEEAEKVINNKFPQNGELLYSYKYDKRNKELYIYHIKAAREIKCVADKADNLIIIPFHEALKNLCMSKNRKSHKEFIAVARHNNKYYYIEVCNKLISKCSIVKNIEEILNFINISEIREIYFFAHEKENMYEVIKKCGCKKEIKIFELDREKEIYDYFV